MTAASARIATLAEVEAVCWRELGQAAKNPAHEWRVLALATCDSQGIADVRSIVIREVLAEDRTLIFYTDERSPKAAQIRSQPLATLLAWSHSLGWQLRLRVSLEIETAGLKTSSRWARLKMTPAAQDYLSPLPPGAKLGQPTPMPPVRGSRDYFAVITARVVAIDWTELHAEGHRRAVFAADGANWVQP
jgi:hypothetical protein